MTQANNLRQTTHATSLGLRMLIGASIGLILIGIFLYLAGPGRPEWGPYWKIRPLLVVPFAGATGGFCYHFITRQFQTGWQRPAAIVLSILICIVGLWMGTVLGLAGTLWN